MHSLQHFQSQTLHIYRIHISSIYIKPISGSIYIYDIFCVLRRSTQIILNQHLMPSILPTEFPLEDLLQSSQYSSKFHCFRLKKKALNQLGRLTQTTSLRNFHFLREMLNENLMEGMLRLCKSLITNLGLQQHSHCKNFRF